LNDVPALWCFRRIFLGPQSFFFAAPSLDQGSRCLHADVVDRRPLTRNMGSTRAGDPSDHRICSPRFPETRYFFSTLPAPPLLSPFLSHRTPKGNFLQYVDVFLGTPRPLFPSSGILSFLFRIDLMLTCTTLVYVNFTSSSSNLPTFITASFSP